MNSYKYTALSPTGEKVTGMIEAVDQLDATSRIKQQYEMILSIKELKSDNGLPGFLNMEIGGSKLNNKEFTLMCNQLATILSADISISNSYP